MPHEFVVTRGLVKHFGERNVIDNLSFSVGEGQITGLLGPNGSGKTTVVRLLNGVLRPISGRISVAGLDPVTEGDKVRAMSGVLTESADFYRHMSGLDNLLFFGELYGVHDRRRSEELLDMFGLAPHQHKPVGTYSTGMRKRLGLAKALLHRPRILFLDEPTNGLDPEGVRLVLGHIRQLNREFGTTILICSHLLNQMEAVCHRYLFINEGRLIEQGSLEELRQRHSGGLQVSVDLERLPEGEFLGPGVLRSVEPGTFGNHRALYEVARMEDVPELLRTLVQQTAVYGARVVEADLESLYFAVGEGGGPS